MALFTITLTQPGCAPTLHTRRCAPFDIIDVVFAMPGVTPLTKIEWQASVSRLALVTPEDLADMEITRANERSEQRAAYRRELREERQS